MHGAILHSLQAYVIQTHGRAAWRDVVGASGLSEPLFAPTRSYPDADTLFILQGIVAHTGQPATEVLERFGEFLVPHLLQAYGGLLDSAWRTLDVIENTEDTIHRVVRARNPGASPPALHTVRENPGKVVVSYHSPRRMCHLGVGICRGLARHFNERVAIDQPCCMHRGASHCEIVVTQG